jgi:FkbM family methyltransferase
MPEVSLREIAKKIVPAPGRRLLRSVQFYFERVGRWPIILWQVRGADWRDEWVLVRSALASPVVSARKLLEWQDPVLLDDARVIVRGVGEFEVRAFSDDLWHVLPWREREIVAVLRRHLRPGDTFVDAGANIGFYTVLASQLVGKEGAVIAVEMMPDTAERLARNIGLNDASNVEIANVALSDRAGETVSVTVTPGKYGKASIMGEGREGKTVRLDASTSTLDDLLDGRRTIRLVKMDLEGAEEAALRGGARTLERVKHLVYESFGARRRSDDPVGATLEAAGFQLHVVDGNNLIASRPR